MRSEKIRVMVVDDSAMIREFLRSILSTTPDIEVVATANDPYFARDEFIKHRPDVIILDVEMPRMDGLTFLKKLMAAHPTPVVMFSTYTQAGAQATLTALALGAVDFVAKPTLRIGEGLAAISDEITEKVRNAAQARVGKPAPPAEKAASLQGKGEQAVASLGRQTTVSEGMVLLLGASTGGTVALERVLGNLPEDSPPIAVVQHMPLNFTQAFAQRLDSLCAISVSEAVDFQPLARGQAAIAPGGKHLLLERGPEGYFVRVKEGPTVNQHKPSVDVLFRSAVNSAGREAVAVLMTGMGKDGAKGLLELRKAGGLTLAQDEATSTIFGMPRAAIDMGAVEKVVSLDQIAPLVNNLWRQGKGRSVR